MTDKKDNVSPELRAFLAKDPTIYQTSHIKAGGMPLIIPAGAPPEVVELLETIASQQQEIERLRSLGTAGGASAPAPFPNPEDEDRANIRTMTYQTRVRADGARERFDYVLGKEPKLLSGKGKYYLLNYKGLKEAYDLAVAQCPMAADAILALIWDETRSHSTLAFLAKEFESDAQSALDAAVAAERAKWEDEVAEIKNRLKAVEKIQGLVRAEEREACAKWHDEQATGLEVEADKFDARHLIYLAANCARKAMCHHESATAIRSRSQSPEGGTDNG